MLSGVETVGVAMGDSLLIYGSYGYTGSLITEAAVAAGLEPTLAGRSTRPLADQATRYGLEHRAFTLEYPSVVDDRLEKFDAVLNCAGPFPATADPMVEACLRTHTDYVDIAGRIDVLESIAHRDDAAVDADITLLPAVGFNVVPTDCLAVHLADQVAEPTTLRLAIDGLSTFSPGTVKSIIDSLDRPGAVRDNGTIRNVPLAWRTDTFEFPYGRKHAVTVPWGDVSTAYHATEIPTVETYATVPRGTGRLMELARPFTPLLGSSVFRTMLTRIADIAVSGPSAAERNRNRTFVYGEVIGEEGDRTAAGLELPDTYDLTAATAVESVRRVLKGDLDPGFLTPALAFGPEFIRSFDHVEFSDIEVTSP